MKEFINNLMTTNGVITMGVIVWIITKLKDAYYFLWKLISKNYIMSIYVSGQKSSIIATKYIFSIVKGSRSVNLIKNNIMMLENQIEYSLGIGVYIFKIDKFTWVLMYSMVKEMDKMMMPVLDMYFYGLNRKKHYLYLKKVINTQNNDTDKSIPLLRGGFLDTLQTHLVYNRKVIGNSHREVIDTIHDWENNKELDKSFNKPHVLKLLLEGPPGCGKSSTIQNIISNFNISAMLDLREYLLINKGDSSVNVSIIKAINDYLYSYPGIKLIIIEEIERIYATTKSVIDDDINHSKYSLLMNILDGLYTPDNTIIIMTTNDLESLPEVLIRAGRVNKIIHYGEFTDNEVKEYTDHYNVDYNLFKDTRNPANLESAVYEYKINKNRVDAIC